MLVKTEFKLNESLFNEDLLDEDDEQVYSNDMLKGIFQNKVDLDSVNSDTLQMIQNPYFKEVTDKNGNIIKPKRLKQEALMLVKLYELTVNPGTGYTHQGAEYIDPFTAEVFPGHGISRADLIKMVGVALPNTKGETSTYFNDFKRLGLAYINPTHNKNDENIVFPGSFLDDWIHGTLSTSAGLTTFDKKTGTNMPYSQHVDLSGEVGTAMSGNRMRKSPSASKTANPGTTTNTHATVNPFEKFKGITPVETKSKVDDDDPFAGFGPGISKVSAENDELPNFDTASTEVPENETPVKPVSKLKRNWFHESITESEELHMPTTKYNDFIENVICEYKQKCHLAEDADITDKFDDHAFKSLCMVKSWPYLQTKEKLFKRINTKNEE